MKKKWYAAHLVFSRENNEDKSLEVNEVVYLVATKDLNETRTLMDKIGQSLVTDPDAKEKSACLYGYKYEGVRGFMNVCNPWYLDQDEDPPTSGTEITYVFYSVKNGYEAIDPFMKGGALLINGIRQ